MGVKFLDGAFFVGAGLAAYGFWLAWHPLGFIIGGLGVSASAYLVASRGDAR